MEQLCGHPVGFACAVFISSLILPVKEQYYPALNMAELLLKSLEFCLCKEYAVPIYGHFTVQDLLFLLVKTNSYSLDVVTFCITLPHLQSSLHRELQRKYFKKLKRAEIK